MKYYNCYSNPKLFRKKCDRAKAILKSRNILREEKRKQNILRKRLEKQNRFKLKSITVPVPKDFSLLTNADKVLSFFRDCKNLHRKGYQIVRFDFKDVHNIGDGAITILISISGELSDKNVQVQTNRPLHEKAHDYIVNSGYLNYFYFGKKITNQASPNVILRRGKDKTDTKASAEMIHKAMETVWGKSMRNTKLQGMLIELMANTVNHAYYQTANQRGWYFAVNHRLEENKVAFTFVDNGVGILKTINLKLQDRFAAIFDNDSLIRDAFDGKFGSRTKLKNRGRGLPVIKKNFNNNIIRNLRVITNDIEYDFEKETVRKLATSFDGTFYYWELDKECKQWNMS